MYVAYKLFIRLKKLILKDRESWMLWD